MTSGATSRRPTFTYPGIVLSLVAGGLLWSWARPALAADPLAADCLASSAASLTLDTQHRLRAELAELLSCASAGCPPEIRQECVRRVDDVNAAIPTIIFEAKDEAGNDLSAVKVSMDGESLSDRLEGIALPVDPGSHLFTFEAAGRSQVRRRLVIREGEKRRLETIRLTSPSEPGRSALSAPPVDRSPSGAPPVGLAVRKASSSSNVLAIVSASMGVAGLGVGAAFGLQAISKRNDARKICPDVCPDQGGVDMWHDAKRAATLSTIAFAIGGAGVAGGVILWLTGRPSSEAVEGEAQVALGAGTIAVRGRW